MWGTGKVKGVLWTPTEGRKPPTDPFILIKAMTFPEDVEYMKKAVAVVTVEGGTACHAAIVCTMLNKPCIIGMNDVVPGRYALEIGGASVSYGTLASLNIDRARLEVDYDAGDI